MLHRLSIKLMVTIGLLTALLFAAISSVTWTLHSKHLEDEVVRQAAVLSETIRLGLRDRMFANRFSEVDSIIQRIGSQRGIDRIRIFSKTGSVLISTYPAEVGTVFNLKTPACRPCHVAGTPEVVLTNPERTRTYRSPDGHRVLGMITPIRNEPDCSSASCHAHPPTRNILGVLDVNLSLATTDQSLTDESRKFTIVSVLGCLLIVMATGTSLWRLIYRPINDLAIATHEVSAGNLDYHIPKQSTDEFAALARLFNSMTDDMKAARDEITTWSHTLEQRVEEKTRELRDTQDRMIQTEKMASLGKLAAVVAHEINNPLAGILTYIKLLRRMLRKGSSRLNSDEADHHLEMMEAETVRVGNIVKNLLAFSRPSHAEIGDANVNAIIERSLQLVAHQMDLQSVECQAELAPDVPVIKADPSQVQQALLAIIINAVEAMPDGGRVTVASGYEPAARRVTIRVSDTGRGIPEDSIPHLFEPFFTTKTEGKGVGLGLFVAYGIIRRHGGTVEVASKLHGGTTFTISLPQDGVAPPDGSAQGGMKAGSDAHPSDEPGAARPART